MPKIQLFLLDHDPDYADMLAAYIRQSDFGEKLQVKMFTKLDYASEALSLEDSPLLVLYSNAFRSIAIHSDKQHCFLLLDESSDGGCDPDSEDACLYRYQPLEQLLTRAIARFGSIHQAPVLPVRRRSEIISFFSAVGNCGKTIAAIHLAKQLAYRGKRVFYLNLESVSAGSLLQSETDQRQFAQIIYYAKHAPQLLKAKLELLRSCDSRFGIHYLPPLNHVQEAQEITAEDMRLLLNALIESGIYDTVIMDLESSLQPRITAALQMSDRVYWLLLDDMNCLQKTKSLLKQMSVVPGVRYILNKFTGGLFNDFNSAGLALAGFLPYIPEWKTVHSADQVWSVPVYSQQVYELYSGNEPAVQGEAF